MTASPSTSNTFPSLTSDNSAYSSYDEIFTTQDEADSIISHQSGQSTRGKGKGKNRRPRQAFISDPSDPDSLLSSSPESTKSSKGMNKIAEYVL